MIRTRSQSRQLPSWQIDTFETNNYRVKMCASVIQTECCDPDERHQKATFYDKWGRYTRKDKTLPPLANVNRN
jgi:hypothetical protein